MLKWMFPKAIVIGILVNIGAYMGVWFVFNIGMFLYNLLLSQLNFIDIDLVFRHFYESVFINWAMIWICCAIPLAGNYLSGRLSKHREWINGFFVYAGTLIVTYYLGWDVDPAQVKVVLLLVTLFSALGSYFAFTKNREELRYEKARNKINV